MPRYLWPLLLATLACQLVVAAENQAVTFYVQIIRGTDHETPQNPKWKPVGPKLAKSLSPVFKWKNYWATGSHEIRVTPGKVGKISATPERDLQIELLKEGQAELRLYRKNQLTRKMRVSIDSKMSVIGGDADNEGWFIVVRRDRPVGE